MLPVLTRPRGFKNEMLVGVSTTVFISLSTSDKVSLFAVPETFDAALEGAVADKLDRLSGALNRFAHDFGTGGEAAVAVASVNSAPSEAGTGSMTSMVG